MILNTDIPELLFSYNLFLIELSEVESNVVFMLSHKNNKGGFDEVLYETYTPDNENRISIVGIDEVLRSYLLENPVSDFKLQFINNEELEISREVKIIYSHVELEGDTNKILNQRFLSLMTGDKTVYPDSIEYLHVYPLKQEKVQINIICRNSVDDYVYRTIIGKTLEANKIQLLDVSPSIFTEKNEVLVKYEVMCGSRRMTFFVDHLRKSTLQVMFTNNFGMPETFSTVADWSSEHKYKNEFGQMKGLYKKYAVSMEKEILANTGLLDQHTANWLELDLFKSMRVFEIRNCKIWKPITIINQTVKRSSDKGELPSFDFTYRLEQKNHAVLDFRTYLYRIFSPIFSKIFS